MLFAKREIIEAIYETRIRNCKMWAGLLPVL